jgi:hypothetical protein
VHSRINGTLAAKTLGDAESMACHPDFCNTLADGILPSIHDVPGHELKRELGPQQAEIRKKTNLTSR